jgi:subtilisin family serine protease
MLRASTLIAPLAIACGLVAAGGSASSQTKIEAALIKEARSAGKVRVIVLTKPDPDQSGGGPAVRNAANYLSGRLGGTASHVTALGRISGVSAEITPEALERLREDPNVALVTRDIPAPPTLFKSVPSVGADRYHARGVRGTGLNVAVLDSGVDKSHPALAGSIVAEACFSTPRSGIYRVKSLCPQGLDAFLLAGAAGGCPKDVPGCDHGTHVAGIVAGHDMNVPGRDFGGVAPAAKVVAVQVFTLFEDPAHCLGAPRCILSFSSDQLRALEWIYRRRDELKIAAINMSLGGGYFDSNCDAASPLTEIIERLRAKQIPTVIAAGNERFFDGISEPACISHAVSVSALGHDGELDVSYSNVAPFVTFAAPGTDITSTIFNAKLDKMTGTSMAAPHVAAAFALLRQQHPAMTVKEVTELLKGASVAVSDPRTGTSIGRMELAKLAAPEGAQIAMRRSVAPTVAARGPSPAPKEAAPKEFAMKRVAEQQAGASESYILKTTKSAAEIKSTLDQKCQHNCQLRQIGTDAFKLDIGPQVTGAGARSSPGAAKLPDKAEVERMFGADVKVYDNRLSRPSR